MGLYLQDDFLTIWIIDNILAVDMSNTMSHCFWCFNVCLHLWHFFVFRFKSGRSPDWERRRSWSGLHWALNMPRRYFEARENVWRRETRLSKACGVALWKLKKNKFCWLSENTFLRFRSASLFLMPFFWLGNLRPSARLPFCTLGPLRWGMSS